MRRATGSAAVSKLIGIALSTALIGSALAGDPPESDVEPVTVKPASERERLIETSDEAGQAAEAPVMIVTATRTRRDPFEVPRSIRVFTRDEIQDVGSFVGMKAISRRDAGIWYDERTSTTTDPIIRGFAGFNLLTLIDGNTLSTLWGEGGFGADDMYGKIDPESIERIDVIRGPNSALYGSNALGAVINVITRSSPIDYTDEGMKTGLRTKFGASWGSRAETLRTEVFGATPAFKFLLGGSARDFDDLRGGGSLGTLDPSGGRERNWDLSGELRLAEEQFLRFTVQDVHRDHIERYYRPTQVNVNDREAFSLAFRDESEGPFWDRMEANLYFQDKVDERSFFDTNTRGRATTKTWQSGFRVTKDVGSGHVITAGLHGEWTDGDSPDDEQFTRVFPSPKRRDAPLSSWSDLGIYLQDEWQASDDWNVTTSIRHDRQSFSTRVDRNYVPPLGNPRDDDISDRVGAWTGGIGAVRRVDDHLRVFGNYARGFRQSAPNFGLRQLGDGILIPNDLLDPTTSDNFEVGVKGRYPGFTFEVSAYHSKIENWQGDLRTTTHNGARFLDFNQNGSRDANEGFVTQVNGGDASVTGLEINSTLAGNRLCSEIPDEWSLWGSFAWNEGSVDATDTQPHSEPMRHTQPMRGLIGVRWDDVDAPDRGLFFEVVADMVGRFDEISSDRQENDLAWRRDPQDGDSPFLRSYVGTPGYTLFHIYAGVNLTENSRLRVGIENVTAQPHGQPRTERIPDPRDRILISVRITARNWPRRGRPRSLCAVGGTCLLSLLTAARLPRIPRSPNSPHEPRAAAADHSRRDGSRGLFVAPGARRMPRGSPRSRVRHGARRGHRPSPATG
jgi:outer membrane receptor protein involved in Fe transport